MSQNIQTHFAARLSVSDYFGTLCIKGLNVITKVNSRCDSKTDWMIGSFSKKSWKCPKQAKYNLIHVNGLFLYPLQTSAILVFWYFQGYRKKQVVWNGLTLKLCGKWPNGSGNSFSTRFCEWFSKMFLMLYFINWPVFIVWLPLCLSWDIDHHCNCLFPSLWRHKFWNKTYLSNHAVFLHGQSQEKKLNILTIKEDFKLK